jgi:hypothetical protein
MGEKSEPSNWEGIFHNLTMVSNILCAGGVSFDAINFELGFVVFLVCIWWLIHRICAWSGKKSIEEPPLLERSAVISRRIHVINFRTIVPWNCATHTAYAHQAAPKWHIIGAHQGSQIHSRSLWNASPAHDRWFTRGARDTIYS